MNVYTTKHVDQNIHYMKYKIYVKERKGEGKTKELGEDSDKRRA